MAIFGIGAFYKKDASQAFIEANLVGIGHSVEEAPELHQFMRALKVGDVVYIKSFSPKSPEIFIRGIGVITDDEEVRDREIRDGRVSCGRNVKWVVTQEFRIPKPLGEKNNVRNNSIYEEFQHEVQRLILEKF
ncbi:MAG: hypothetical protein OXB94_09710 [Nitrospira sp.]|nr:hypothetical protein [Nitrospira sp.]